MNFAYIPIFVRKHIAKEVTEKVVELFSSVDYLDENLQMDIHQVLKRMIKVHFAEDENKVRELLTMITKTVDEDVRNKFPSYVRALEQIQERDAAIARQKKTIESRDELLSSQEDMLNSMDELLAEKDLVIERLRQELDIAKSK
ncbi:hypothetical protein [Methanobrevibacter sp.]|uniref:hypothetical protein n=1 Tax=Methanobrevibacter sp. TaxID=66852 RepID=UPI003890C657